jgi:cytoskeletal protein CcmA (bactofilin family)
MWKKDEVPTQTPTATRPEPTPRPERPTSSSAPAERATIGRSITIKGEVTGDEDLLIQGRVDGSVDLKQHAVTVGPDGEVKASIIARVVTVEGRVEGDLNADEQVILRSSASVHGDITAPRVVLEDGARFRGGVDMGEPKSRSNSASPSLAKKAEHKSAAEAVDSTPRPKSVNQSPAEVKS